MAEEKSKIERLVAEFGAQDLGTYMDARVGDKVHRVAVWNEGLKSYQPTAEGEALLNPPEPVGEVEEKDTAAASPSSPGKPGKPKNLAGLAPGSKPEG